jgi:hypothetical protein
MARFGSKKKEWQIQTALFTKLMYSPLRLLSWLIRSHATREA